MSDSSSRRFAQLAVVLAFACAAAAQESMISIEINGAVTTEEGEPLPNCRIQLSFTRIFVDEEGVTETEDDVVAGVTDEDGNFSLEMMIEPNWTGFVLRINAARIDPLRYEQPTEVDLTDVILNGISSGNFVFTVNRAVESRPRWQELKEMIERYGQDSDKGRLLDQLGLPEMVREFVRDGRRGSIWFYYSLGRAFRFLGDEQEVEFRFLPQEYRPEEHEQL